MFIKDSVITRQFRCLKTELLKKKKTGKRARGGTKREIHRDICKSMWLSIQTGVSALLTRSNKHKCDHEKQEIPVLVGINNSNKRSGSVEDVPIRFLKVCLLSKTLESHPQPSQMVLTYTFKVKYILKCFANCNPR